MSQLCCPKHQIKAGTERSNRCVNRCSAERAAAAGVVLWLEFSWTEIQAFAAASASGSMDTQHSSRHSSLNLNEISCVSDYTLGLFKQLGLNPWINQRLWRSRTSPLSFPIHHGGVCNPLWLELKTLLARSAFWGLFSPKPSLNKRAVGGGRINICWKISYQRTKSVVYTVLVLQ